MVELTVVLTNYLRYHYMRSILDALVTQSIPHYRFVWDNSPTGTFQDPRVDWVIRSSRNAKCGARWWLAAHAETPYVLVMDDDLIPTDAAVLADTIVGLTNHAPNPVGATGVRLLPDKAYNECSHIGLESGGLAADTVVDIVKGRYFAAQKDCLRELPYLPIECEDDIAVSASLGGGVILAALQGRLLEFPTGKEARCRRSDHKVAREAARREWFDSAH